MSAVTVSSKYQIVIPKEVRKSMGIRPGQKVDIIKYDGLIHIIPLAPIRKLRGSLRGIDTRILREKDRT